MKELPSLASDQYRRDQAEREIAADRREYMERFAVPHEEQPHQHLPRGADEREESPGRFGQPDNIRARVDIFRGLQLIAELKIEALTASPPSERILRLLDEAERLLLEPTTSAQPRKENGQEKETCHD